MNYNVNEPLVTVGTLCYNTGKFVLETLECIKKQTYKNIQHIIIDDCSTDNSVELIKQWITDNNYECTFITNEKNKGISKSLNIVLENTKGKYLGLLGDDLWDLDKIEYQVELFEKLGPDYGMIYCDCILFDSDTGKRYYGTQIGGPYLNVAEGFIFEHLLKYPIPGIGTLLSVDAMHAIGKYDEDLSFEDWDFAIRMSKQFKIKFDDRLDSYYRIRSDGLHKTLHQEKHNETCIRIYNKHWGFTAAGDKIVKEKLNYWLERSIRSNPKMARPYIKDFYKRTKSNPLLYYFSILRLPGNLYYWLRVTIELIKNRKIELNYLE
jgi:glycosyltransferase involved in cell wall biosynthesis